MKKNKKTFKDFLLSDGGQTLITSIICAILGLIVGFIALLSIEPKAAGKGFAAMILNYFSYLNGNGPLSLRISYVITYFAQALTKTAPLIISGLAILFAYKAGLFNIGASGQFTVGVLFSLYPALAWSLPWYLCLLFGIIGGAIWGSISGALKAYLNVNEVISGIMLNWIGLYLVNMAFKSNTTKVWDDIKFETFALNTRSISSLPSIGLNTLFSYKYITIAVFIAIIIPIIFNIIINKTTFGYELKATGMNKHAAKYAGMKEKRNIVITLAISGGLAGLSAGLFYLTGIEPWYCPTSVPAMGFNGISVAFLGGLSPIGAIFSSYFITHITEGGSMLDTTYYSPEIANVVTSLIIYFCAFVAFMKIYLSKKIDKKSQDTLANANSKKEDK